MVLYSPLFGVWSGELFCFLVTPIYQDQIAYVNAKQEFTRIDLLAEFRKNWGFSLPFRQIFVNLSFQGFDYY